MAAKLEKQQEMFSLIESWKTSGQSQQVFCKTQGLSYHIFHYWYKQYRLLQESPHDDGSKNFIPVQLSGTLTGLPIAELVFPDGRRLNFYQAVDASFLRTLLS